MMSGCIAWTILGAVVISGTSSFIILSLWKIHELVKSQKLKWSAFEHRTLKQIYQDALAMQGMSAKLLFFFVGIHERRFMGEWIVSDDARLWGFLLEETGTVYFCFAIRMLKMILVSIVLNLQIPSMPLVPPLILLSLYVFGAVEALILRANRDIWTNKGEALMAVGNFCAVLMVVLQVAVEEDRLPGFLSGPAVIWLSCATTGVSAVVALAEPVLNLFQGPLGTAVGGIGAGLKRIGLGYLMRPVIHFGEELMFVVIMLFNGVLGREMHRVAEHKLNEELGGQRLFLYATVLRCAEKWKLRTFNHRLHPSAHDRSVGQEDSALQGLGLGRDDAGGSRFVLKINFKLDIRQLGLLSWKMKVFVRILPVHKPAFVHHLCSPK